MTTVFVPEVIIEESDVERLATQRTALKYPTLGPEDSTGRDWHQYFVDAKALYRTFEPEEDDESDEDEDAEPTEIEVLEWAREVDIKNLNSHSRPKQIANRLLAQGWEVRIGQSRARVPEVLYKSDSKPDTPPEKAHLKGDVWREPYELTSWSLIACKRATNGRIGIALQATWTSKNGFRLAETIDPWLGREIRVGYTTARPRNEIELQEAVTPPLGLAEWLDLVCPRPESKRPKKPKKGEAEAKEGDWVG